MGQRIGLFGGTFDPPHSGHLAAALAARDALELDRILLVVANEPWQKLDKRNLTAAHHRLAMTELLVKNIDGIEASDMEIARGGLSYTIDTVLQLQDVGHEVVLVLGADAAGGLNSWERAEELSRLVRVPKLDNWSIDKISAASLDVSSSQVRSLMSEGTSTAGSIPSAVKGYIDFHQLEWPGH